MDDKQKIHLYESMLVAEGVMVGGLILMFLFAPTLGKCMESGTLYLNTHEDYMCWAGINVIVNENGTNYSSIGGTMSNYRRMMDTVNRTIIIR